MKNYMNLQTFVGKPNCTSIRHSVVALLVCLFLVPMNSFCNEITLKEKKSTLESIILELEKQSGSNFVYNSSKIDMNQKLTISAKESKLENVLEEIEDKTSVAFTTIGSKVVMTPMVAVSKEIASGKIVGVVIDAESGDPLPGATIIKKETTAGSISSFDGSFEINAEAGKHQFVVSFIGYNDVTIEVSIKANKTTDLGEIKLEANNVGLEEVKVMASFAKDRETPVAISTIQPELIAEKLGNQEFPEVLKSTPSVYATKTGGGFGDSRISIRGFDTKNIGVLINGVPVNDMENGKVYFSNWAGLSDVTSKMQVQRGLGASKLAISSVGGTINILTKGTDAVQGGSAYVGVGNDGYQKFSFNVSTGLMENGWAVTMMGGTVAGDGYIRGTNFKGYNYLFNVSKRINENHRLSFTAFGAPQWHNQRGNKHLISTYKNKNSSMPFSNGDGLKFNSEWGIRNGEVTGGAYGHNFYHKPQMSLNHFWNINGTTNLSTSVYASVSKGGGRRFDGENDGAGWDQYGDIPNNMEFRTAAGQIDYDKIIQHNADQNGPSDIIMGTSVNSHQWYGVLSTFNTTVGPVNLTAGLDSRYYIGEHTKQVEDLLGGRFFLDDSNVNRSANTPLEVGDYYSYSNDSRVLWNGGFLQGEYVLDRFSAFASASISQQSYQRIDYFNYEKGNQISDWVHFAPWSLKGGVNYNITEKHNVYGNAGYFIRAPYFNSVFENYKNDIAAAADFEYEKVLSFEAGYGFHTSDLSVKVGYYRTEWKDQGLRKKIGDDTYNVLGVTSLHQGMELEAKYFPSSKLTISAMASVGDWKYQNDVHFTVFDDNNEFLGEYNAYLKDVSVGNSAQTVAALGVDYKVLKGLKIGIDANYYGNNFAEFDPSLRTTTASAGVNSWQMPDAVLFDMNATYRFKIGALEAKVFGKITNLLDEEYVADANDGATHNWDSALVYYGFGRTWSTGLKINF